MNARFFSILATVLVVSIEASQDPLGKYSLILDKGLFGKEEKPVVVPPAPTPTPPPVSAGWAKQFQMTMMTLEDHTNRVRIGLQNLQNKTSMLLIEGEDPFDGYTLQEADFSNKKATVVYGGVPHVFDLTRGNTPVSATNRNGNRTGNRATSTRPEFRRRNTPTVRPRTTPTPKPPVQARQWKSRDEYQKHLQQQNEDAIRTGKPPLPIPLTPEQDARLVKEGVLPPRR